MKWRVRISIQCSSGMPMAVVGDQSVPLMFVKEANWWMNWMNRGLESAEFYDLPFRWYTPYDMHRAANYPSR